MGYPERLEQGVNRLLYLRPTRPQFILTSVVSILAGTGIGLYTENRNTPPDFEYDIYPGWIESNIKAPFLQVSKGHFHFLREGIFSNPDILGVTQDFFGLIGEHLDKKEVLPLGEALEFCQTKMRERLVGKSISPDANFDLEVLHGAFFAFTAGYTAQWFSMDDFYTFGVSRRFKSPDEYSWGPNGAARIVYPGYFSTGLPDDPSSGEIKNGGQDRSGHITHHSFLGFELMYSQAYNLKLDVNMPLFARFLVWFGNVGSKEELVTTFSDRVGMFYELSRLTNPNYWPVNGRTPHTIPDGPFDDAEPMDIKGNRLGVKFGIRTYQLTEDKKPLKPLLSIIDNNFKHSWDEPELMLHMPS